MSNNTSPTTTTASASASASPQVLLNKSLICQDSTVSIGVQIGIGTVVHPKSSIIIKEGAGEIIIGENNILEEFVTVINDSPEPMIIGSNNLFEVGTYIECKSIGDSNVFEPKSKVLKNSIIKNQCTIGVGCVVAENRTCENNTAITQTSNSQIENISSIPFDNHSGIHKTHLQLLHKTIPLFHTLKKPSILEK